MDERMDGKMNPLNCLFKGLSDEWENRRRYSSTRQTAKKRLYAPYAPELFKHA